MNLNILDTSRMSLNTINRSNISWITINGFKIYGAAVFILMLTKKCLFWAITSFVLFYFGSIIKYLFCIIQSFNNLLRQCNLNILYEHIYSLTYCICISLFLFFNRICENLKIRVYDARFSFLNILFLMVPSPM